MRLTILSYNVEGLTLEYNYCIDQSLEQYIIKKSKVLNKYLAKIDADIICIQEYTPILNINPGDEYSSIKDKPYAIFYRKSMFEFISHKCNETSGLVATLSMNGFIFKVGANRLPASSEKIATREKILNDLDKASRDEISIYALDTNMKKSEEKPLKNLADCFYQASVTKGYYTLDKKTNPYFLGDDKNLTRTCYDKIFCSKIFDCEQCTILTPKSNKKLVHTSYPFGGLSDHYPLLAVLTIDE